MNPLVVIAGAAVALSYFLPWVSQPVLGTVSPQDALGPVVQGLIDNPSLDSLRAVPPLVLAFMLSFVLAALAALLSLIGAGVRLVVFLAGVLPFGIAGYMWFMASDRLVALGLPAPDAGDLTAVVDSVRNLAEAGFYAWAGGAAVLLVVSLFPRRA